MNQLHDHNIWQLLFEQTPPILRYILAILTLGLFSLVRYIWKHNQLKIDYAISKHESFATRKEVIACKEHLDSKIDLLHSDVREIRGMFVKHLGDE